MNKRLLSMIMVLSMVFTHLPILAMAEEASTPIDANGEIIVFTPLAETEKTVEVGTSIENLGLPETLTARVQMASTPDSGAAESLIQDSGSGEEYIAAKNSEPSKAGEASDSNLEETDPNLEEIDSNLEEIDSNLKEIDSNLEEIDSNLEETDPNLEENDSNLEEIDSSLEEIESNWEETTVDIPVTWISQPEYDKDTVGNYVFTPVIEGYTVSAELPEIKVMVGAVAAPVMMLTAGTPIEIATFANLQSALDNAKSHVDLKLSHSYTETIGTLTIASDKNYNITIDLNGKTLDGGSNPAIMHYGSGTLTITDKSSGGGGKITSCARTTIYLNGGKLTVDSGTVENTEPVTYEPIRVSFDTIYNKVTGKIIISGTAEIIGESSTGIWLDTGVADTTILEISGGTIRSTYGSAIENRGPGKIVISGGSPVISGGYRAMNTVPDLSSFGDVKVTASGNSDGSFPERTYYPYDYEHKTYKYLKFEPAPDIARIGSKGYPTLQAAVDAITESGQTIDMLGNVDLTFPFFIDSENDKSFTLNLNGFTIDYIRSAIEHRGSGTLTITDNSTEGGGLVTSIYGYTVLLNGGSLVVSGGTIENTAGGSSCYTIYNQGDGSVSVVSNGVVKSQGGSAIYNLRVGKITISDNAKVTGTSRSVSKSGIIHLDSWGLLEINGGTIENTDYGYGFTTLTTAKLQ